VNCMAGTWIAGQIPGSTCPLRTTGADETFSDAQVDAARG